MPKDSGIGASSKRREDVRFLTGAGNYTDDINLGGQAYVAFLRSDVAHGTLNGVDTSAAAAMPGGASVITISSLTGVLMAESYAAYAGAKAGINHVRNNCSTR